MGLVSGCARVVGRKNPGREGLQTESVGRGLWRGTPAAGDAVRYWATGVEAYFNAAGVGVPPVGAARPVVTREGLKAYDAGLFGVVDEVMGYGERVDWRYTAPSVP